MKFSSHVVLSAVAAVNVAAHATFQQLWVDGVDFGSQCIRMPTSNNPVTNVGGADIRCNAGTRGVSGKCPVKAGSTVTIEMHQTKLLLTPVISSNREIVHAGRRLSEELTDGPVNVYLSKVSDASSADGSTPWYKIFADSWSAKGTVGDGDNWGTNDLNSCCGKMDVLIPADTPSGDYLLRSEVIALHTAGGSGGAQFYISCYQITVAGSSGSAVPAGVSLPGALKASDPGILINIHAKVANYVNPGPAVIAGGTTKTAGSTCSGCAATCSAGKGPTGTAIGAPVATSPGTSPGGGAGCAQQRYQQCGGDGYAGCTACADGLSCVGVSAPYYSQCQ